MTETTDTTIDLSDGQDAVRTVVDDFASSGDPVLNLGMLTDEELFAYTRDLAEAAPFGLWFSRLDEGEQQAAALGAVRARAARGEVGADLGLLDVPLEADEEGSGRVALETPIVAALTLRRREIHFSLRVIGSVGETWYLLRPVEADVWLREAVTSHGFHLLSLVRLDEAERSVYLRRLQLPEDARDLDPPQVSASFTEQELSDASGTGRLQFLDTTVVVGNLTFLAGDTGSTRSRMINVLGDGRLVIGDVSDGRVTYRGASVTDLEGDWDAWVAGVGDVDDGGRSRG